MVDLSHILIPYHFEHGLRMLEKGYAAMRDALLAEAENIEKEARAYEDAIALDESKRIEERDDEGYLLWEQSQIFELKISEVHEAILDFRKSFVVAAYHHWERHATVWCGSPGTHEELVVNHTNKGYRSCPEIGAVRCLANHLKHGPNSKTKWLERLQKEFPAFLSCPTQEPLELSETDVDRVSTAVFATGPYRT
jgi:hypothetical protein